MEPTKRRVMRSIVHLSLLVTAVVLVAGSAKYRRKKALQRAPIMQNPARTGTAGRTPANLRYGTSVAMVSYAPGQGSCFHIQTRRSASLMQTMTFTLRAVNKIDQKLDTAPTVSALGVQVLRSSSRLVPYTTTVRDTVRDANGRIIATRDRNVQRIKRVHSTLARVCFPQGNVPNKDSRFLELIGRSGRSRIWAAWRLQ